MPGRDSCQGQPTPCHIPRCNKAACAQLGAVSPTSQRPQEILRILQRLKTATHGLKQASRSLKDSTETEQAQASARKVLQEAEHLLEPTVVADVVHQTQQYEPAVHTSSEMDSTPPLPIRGSATEIVEHSDIALQSLQQDHKQLQEEHAAALDRIVHLELLVKERWMSMAPGPMSPEPTDLPAQSAIAENADAECEIASENSAHGYKAIATQLAKEVVKLAAQFKQADTLAEQQSDRKRFIFWAEQQVAPFVPML